MIPTSTLGTPNILLDYVKNKLGLETDRELSDRLGISPPEISKVRHGKLKISAPLWIEIHEETGVHIRELKLLAGVKS